MTSSVGDRFGSYELLGVLGRGAMGTVFRARSSGGDIVALKVIKPELAHDAVFRRRFDHEARSAAKVSHEHIVGVLDVGEAEGLAYLAEDYVAGESLGDRVRREGPLALGVVVDVCLQVASGLDALHRAEVVHRDLKPANILLGEDGRAYITDFGVAKDPRASVITLMGQTVGSLGYMAPEQIQGQAVSAATDVYALACVAFECLCGRPPFADRRGMQVLLAHIQDEPPDPCARRNDLPPALGAAVLRALEKDPARRPRTAGEFARDLRAAAAEGG